MYKLTIFVVKRYNRVPNYTIYLFFLVHLLDCISNLYTDTKIRVRGVHPVFCSMGLMIDLKCIYFAFIFIDFVLDQRSKDSGTFLRRIKGKIHCHLMKEIMNIDIFLKLLRKFACLDLLPHIKKSRKENARVLILHQVTFYAVQHPDRTIPVRNIRLHHAWGHTGKRIFFCMFGLLNVV